MTFKQLIRFTNDAAGLERLLRLLQSLSQILAAWALSAEDAKIWLLLRRQFALGRRYFRFFKFMTCFEKVVECFYTRNEGNSGFGIRALLEVGKWSCLGAYLFLESVTILDAMGVWITPWAEVCMLEANRFWFYSLVCSLIAGGMMLFFGDKDERRVKVVATTNRGRGKSKESDVSKKDRSEGKSRVGQKDDRHDIKRRFVADGFDLLVPGSITGWIPTSPAVVGFASAISTILSSRDIWDRLQG